MTCNKSGKSFVYMGRLHMLEVADAVLYRLQPVSCDDSLFAAYKRNQQGRDERDDAGDRPMPAIYHRFGGECCSKR
ncbi:hypothetical protein D3C80_1995300 [compost metagenome]